MIVSVGPPLRSTSHAQLSYFWTWFSFHGQTVSAGAWYPEKEERKYAWSIGLGRNHDFHKLNRNQKTKKTELKAKTKPKNKQNPSPTKLKKPKPNNKPTTLRKTELVHKSTWVSQPSEIVEKENNILFNWCMHADIKMHLEVGGFMLITNRWVCSRPHHLLWMFSGINLVLSDDKQPQSITFIILTDQATKAKCISSRKGGIKPKSNSHTAYMHAVSLRRKGATLHLIWNCPGNPSLTVLILRDESSF